MMSRIENHTSGKYADSLVLQELSTHPKQLRSSRRESWSLEPAVPGRCVETETGEKAKVPQRASERAGQEGQGG